MKEFSFKEVLSGNVLGNAWLRRQYKIILLISGLIFVYIYCEYKSQRQRRELNELKKELSDTQMRKKYASIELMSVSRRSTIINMLEAKGSDLKESTTPAIRIQ
jgi:hypothetical protein